MSYGIELPRASKRGPAQAQLALLSDRDVEYIAPPTLRAFHRSNAANRMVIGPVGSGKSTGMCMELLRRMKEQTPTLGTNIRQTRFAIVRNTFPQLRDTTKRTWMDWLGKLPHEFAVADFAFRTYFPLPDGTFVQSEALFRPLDSLDDVRKLLSLELTGSWVNEAREIPKEILDALDDRVGRFPAVRLGGCTWRGIICDTNPPDTEHWIYNLREVVKPDNWEFFWQPGGLIELPNGKFVPNPEAENLENLEPDYYARRAGSKPADHVRVYYCSKYGFLKEGKPVIPEYVESTHADDTLLFSPLLPVYVGIDFGLTPAATIGQKDAVGRWLVLDELVSENMGAFRFGHWLKSFLAEHYSGATLIITGDPAGSAQAQTDENTPFNILNSLGIQARPAETNDWTVRREAVAGALTRLIDGLPGLRVRAAKCPVLHRALLGGYCYKTTYTSSGERTTYIPQKNRYSHVADALMYMLIGGGEVREVGSLLNSLIDEGSLSRLSHPPADLEPPKDAADFYGVFVDAGGELARTYIAIRRKNVLRDLFILDTINPKVVTSWLLDRVKVARRATDMVILGSGAETSKIRGELREFGLLTRSVQLAAPHGNYHSGQDFCLFQLKAWLEEPSNWVLGQNLVAELWSGYYSSDKKSRIEVKCSKPMVAMALTVMNLENPPDQKATSRLPSAFVR